MACHEIHLSASPPIGWVLESRVHAPGKPKAILRPPKHLIANNDASHICIAKEVPSLSAHASVIVDRDGRTRFPAIQVKERLFVVR